jgi:hypothetical protein
VGNPVLHLAKGDLPVPDLQQLVKWHGTPTSHVPPGTQELRRCGWCAPDVIAEINSALALAKSMREAGNENGAKLQAVLEQPEVHHVPVGKVLNIPTWMERALTCPTCGKYNHITQWSHVEQRYVSINEGEDLCTCTRKDKFMVGDVWMCQAGANSDTVRIVCVTPDAIGWRFTSTDYIDHWWTQESFERWAHAKVGVWVKRWYGAGYVRYL